LFWDSRKIDLFIKETELIKKTKKKYVRSSDQLCEKESKLEMEKNIFD
jgi:hypothetical protein